jgi:hypothetical protein
MFTSVDTPTPQTKKDQQKLTIFQLVSSRRKLCDLFLQTVINVNMLYREILEISGKS